MVGFIIDKLNLALSYLSSGSCSNSVMAEQSPALSRKKQSVWELELNADCHADGSWWSLSLMLITGNSCVYLMCKVFTNFLKNTKKQVRLWTFYNQVWFSCYSYHQMHWPLYMQQTNFHKDTTKAFLWLRKAFKHLQVKSQS